MNVPHPDLSEFAARAERGYRWANLTKALAQIHSRQRYLDADGVMALTTGELGRFDPAEAQVQLTQAAIAGAAGDATFRPQFGHPAGGLSHGLNPYTDWTMSCLTREPSHTYLFLGLDFYDIAALADVGAWDSYISNPFVDRDRFWHRIWAWILWQTKINTAGTESWIDVVDRQDAADYIDSDGGAFIFHNLLPYLRPAGTGSTDDQWPKKELRKKTVLANVVEDLALLRQCVPGPIRVYCTSAAAVTVLIRAGYDKNDIICWSAHPSQVFHPSTVRTRGTHFLPFQRTATSQRPRSRVK